MYLNARSAFGVFQLINMPYQMEQELKKSYLGTGKVSDDSINNLSCINEHQ